MENCVSHAQTAYMLSIFAYSSFSCRYVCVTESRCMSKPMPPDYYVQANTQESMNNIRLPWYSRLNAYSAKCLWQIVMLPESANPTWCETQCTFTERTLWNANQRRLWAKCKIKCSCWFSLTPTTIQWKRYQELASKHQCHARTNYNMWHQRFCSLWCFCFDLFDSIEPTLSIIIIINLFDFIINRFIGITQHR